MAGARARERPVLIIAHRPENRCHLCKLNQNTALIACGATFALLLPRMRLLAILLSLYAFTLSVTVCADDGCAGKGVIMDTVTASAQHADHVDLCSPFCACACCASVTVAKVVVFSLVLTATPECHALACATKVSAPRPLVWQPPEA